MPLAAAVTWDQDSGTTRCYLDGQPLTAFWRTSGGDYDIRPAGQGGVDPVLAPGSKRGATGSLVLGQDQDCYGGCFSPSNAFDGGIAVLRIWDVVRDRDQIARNMLRDRPDTSEGLLALYTFGAEGIKYVVPAACCLGRTPACKRVGGSRRRGGAAQTHGHGILCFWYLILVQAA